ncbi:MAG: PLP-dependent aminotransferase family protein [Rhizomicrobium sp.]
MSFFIMRIDPKASIGLQDQIRQQLFDAIISGEFVPGRRLPSSRRLARQLGVARNTVVLACQQLIAEGHLVSRERSGLYVNEDVVKGLALSQRAARPSQSENDDIHWHARVKGAVEQARIYRCPPQWQKYPFPFFEGRFDPSLYPIAEWREAMRLALGAKQAQDWTTDTGHADDPMLVKEICEKVLPRRGIKARPDQVLLTAGVPEALHLLTELLVEPGMKVGLEDPGSIAMRQLLQRRSAVPVHFRVDEDGIVARDLRGIQILYVTPSHQRPTAATLSMQRRAQLLRKAESEDFVIVEDDFECETNYLYDAHPALRGLAGGERVIYVAGLSRALSPGMRLGFIVAAPQIVQEIRALRAVTARQPPASVQRAAALFLSFGHYDHTMLRLGRIFRERMIALRDALNHYLPRTIAVAPVRGGTTFWVRGPEKLDARDLARAAESRGVLIEPVSQYYAQGKAPENIFRLSVTGIAAEKIRPGIVALSELIHEMSAGKHLRLDPQKTKLLSHAELRKLIPGTTLLYKTVYGDPCTIELHRNGEMTGRAGYANEDQDRGRWWIEDGKWCRQWQNWAYGETSKYRTQIKGDRIHWFNEKGRLVDSAIFVRPGTPLGGARSHKSRS